MELIKKLREMTGAGMVDCQKALKESNDDIEKAVELLRKKGIAKAAKRGDREANEGVIKVAVSEDSKEAYMLELNSETDFVARNDQFQDMAESILKVIKENKPENKEALLSLDLNGQSVKEALDVLSGTIGEKMVLKNYAIVTGESVAAYSHLGGKIGVIIALDKEGKDEIANEVAMQVAAANPRYTTSDEVGSEDIEKEKAFQKEQMLKEGKPEEIIEKIVAGKMGKYYSEVCLVEQEFIKDDKKKVKDILDGANVLKFVRFSLSN
ncbi:MAG: translation elongation factor Ts [Patescibacteria group bacterium]|jgi:elongation factor Ts|nr:translation elongation factor Ts [Patescibacteria group bacterium]